MHIWFWYHMSVQESKYELVAHGTVDHIWANTVTAQMLNVSRAMLNCTQSLAVEMAGNRLVLSQIWKTETVTARIKIHHYK